MSHPKALHLPIWRDAQKFLVWAENAVRRFARDHEYTVGTQLRDQALLMCRLVLRAQATEPARRLEVVSNLRLAAEESKVSLQLAKEINGKLNQDAITRLVILMTRLVLCFPSRPWRPLR